MHYLTPFALGKSLPDFLDDRAELPERLAEAVDSPSSPGK